MNTVLVTGGAGYIGSCVVRTLLSKYRVRTLDNLSFGKRGIKAVLDHPHFEFVHGDIREVKDVTGALADIEAVVHLAAIVGDPACAKYQSEATEVNKHGSELLYETALNNKVKRFVFASTCSNYGKMSDKDVMLDESSPLNPVSHYARLKVEFEQRLLQSNHRDMVSVCLRFATAYGVSPRPRFDLTVNEFTRELLLGRKLEIYGQQFWRPYCHVNDIANACQLALEADGAKVARQAFNVGTNEENYRKIELVKLILEELPQAESLVEYVHRDEDPRDYRVSFDRINSELGFSTSVTVRDGIREIIEAIEAGSIPDPDHPELCNV